MHAVEAGMLGARDEEQLEKAILEQRTFLTHNKKHFRILHEKYLASGKKHFLFSQTSVAGHRTLDSC